MSTHNWHTARWLQKRRSLSTKPASPFRDNLRPGFSYIGALALVLVFVLGTLLAFFPGQRVLARSAQQGSHDAPAMGVQQAATGPIWYFAEGSVGNSFQEYLTLYNPGATQASASVTYLFQSSRPAQTVTHSVNAHARFTVNVNLDVGVPSNGPQQPIAAIVRSDVPIVAERPMYFTVAGITSGSDVLGTTNTNSSTFYFAEGDARPGYYTWVSILNPSPTDTAHVITHTTRAAATWPTSCLMSGHSSASPARPTRSV